MGTKRFRRVLAVWLPVAGATTVLAFTAYGAVQQVQRTDADDPQVQLARDAAAAIGAGADPSSVATGPTVDVETSLAPWIAVYGADGTPIASTGAFQGKAPEVPTTVLSDARDGERSFSWEPRDGLRFATVAVPVGDGSVVVAARSLAEVERRESRTLQIAAVGLLAALAAAAIGAVLGVWLRDRGAQPH
ncbi:MAG: hypothetical protein ABJB55_05840 [Actinomycetota bacterium]